MKKLLYLTLMLVSIVLTGCEKNTIEHGDLGPHHVLVIKYSNPEYRNYVIAYQEDEHYNIPSEWIMGPWANWPNKKPYYELTDGYLLLDWRLNFVLLKFGVLIDVEWEEARKVTEKWSLETKIDSAIHLLEESYLIPYGCLEAYCSHTECKFPWDTRMSFEIPATASIENQQKWEKTYDEIYKEKVVQWLNKIISNEGLKAACDSININDPHANWHHDCGEL